MAAPNLPVEDMATPCHAAAGPPLVLRNGGETDNSTDWRLGGTPRTGRGQEVSVSSLMMGLIVA